MRTTAVYIKLPREMLIYPYIPRTCAAIDTPNYKRKSAKENIVNMLGG